MSKALWTSIGFCGLLQASLIQASIAAPIVPPETPIASSHNSLIEQVYYYQADIIRTGIMTDTTRIGYIGMVIGVIIDSKEPVADATA